MRELKFRAFNLETKTMIYLDPLQWPLKALEDEETWKVMQFTGLKDREGKEIWEGDIVQTDNTKHIPRYTPMRVIEKSGCFVFDYSNGIYSIGAVEWCHIEVLGNIYENGDLLNV